MNINPNANAASLLNKLVYAGLGLAAAGGAAELATPIVRATQANSARKRLVDYTPSLQGVDEKVVDDYFNVIKTFAPTIARNAIVSGDLVNKMVQFGGVDHNLVKGMVDIERGASSPGFGKEVLSKGTGKVLGTLFESAIEG